jgi:AcrR family transcriptional regulator
MNKSRGRPRGNPPTKARIADVARALFLRHGYRGTTMRAVADAAGVDSALISYHFGSKQGLDRLAEYLGGPDATDRATAAVAVIGGLIFTRYLNPLRPTARLSAADVHRILGPPLRAALRGSARPRPVAAGALRSG